MGVDDESEGSQKVKVDRERERVSERKGEREIKIFKKGRKTATNSVRRLYQLSQIVVMAASWDAVQMMLGKIWTRLEVIDKLAEAQGKLCQRLDELEKALGRLDPKASAGEAKTPALTAVYDPINKAVKLVTMAQYERRLSY